MERDFTNEWDDPNNPNGPNYRPQQAQTPSLSGSGGDQPWWIPDTSSWNDGYGNPTDGLGSPESGYGEGGVDNPAYQNPWNMDLVNQIGAQEAVNPFGTPAPAAAPAPAPRQSQPAFQPPMQMAAPAGPAPSQAPPPSTKTPPITDEVTKILMQRLNELKNPGDIQGDPIYQQALRANQIGLMRSADKQRKALAERSAASGTRATGGFNVGVRGIQERTGEQGAQYASGLALDRLSAREAQLVEAIRLARAVGQDDIANQLEVQRLALQQELGRGDLALRSELGRGQLGLGYDQLGFSYADMIQRANAQAYQSALRG